MVYRDVNPHNMTFHPVITCRGKAIYMYLYLFGGTVNYFCYVNGGEKNEVRNFLIIQKILIFGILACMMHY